MYSALKSRTMWLADKVLERLDNIAHLKEHRITYIEHFKTTLDQSKFFFKNSLYLLVHAIFPHIYTNTPEEHVKFK